MQAIYVLGCVAALTLPVSLLAQAFVDAPQKVEQASTSIRIPASGKNGQMRPNAKPTLPVIQAIGGSIRAGKALATLSAMSMSTSRLSLRGLI